MFGDGCGGAGPEKDELLGEHLCVRTRIGEDGDRGDVGRMFVHEDAEFEDLLRIVASARGLSLGLVEKDDGVTRSTIRASTLLTSRRSSVPYPHQSEECPCDADDP